MGKGPFSWQGLKVLKRGFCVLQTSRKPRLDKTMKNIIVNDNGKIRNVEDIEFAEKITDMRKEQDPWEVIAELITVWAKTTPDDVEAISINLGQYREAQKDKEFAQTEQGGDYERRFQLAFPKNLMLMIRSQYKAEDLPFDREFFAEFVKRYPFFRVSEKI